MIHRSRARSSSLFLMELILAILFFSVASAVCVEFFVKSHLMSRRSEELTHAVNECSSIAEIICTADSLMEGLHMLRLQYPEGDYPDMAGLGDAEDGTDLKEADVLLYYDGDFIPCSQASSGYILEIHLTKEKQMIEAVLALRESDHTEGNDPPVYQLMTKHHIARRTGYDER